MYIYIYIYIYSCVCVCVCKLWLILRNIPRLNFDGYGGRNIRHANEWRKRAEWKLKLLLLSSCLFLFCFHLRTKTKKQKINPDFFSFQILFYFILLFIYLIFFFFALLFQNFVLVSIIISFLFHIRTWKAPAKNILKKLLLQHKKKSAANFKKNIKKKII